MDLETTADELYGLAPDSFTARRAELAARARTGGDKDLAGQIAALRRPTVAAWLVNQLVARDEVGTGRLFRLGDELRKAQAGLLGGRMKELSAQRHQLVSELTDRAADRQKASAAVRREVEETLAAAVADAGAARAVASGRLTRALAYTGFGEVDITAATATPPAPARRTERRDPSTTPQHVPPSARETAVAREEAAARREAAEEAVRASSQAVGRTRAREVEIADAVVVLQRELAERRRELAAATRESAAAARRYERAERAVREAARDPRGRG